MDLAKRIRATINTDVLMDSMVLLLENYCSEYDIGVQGRKGLMIHESQQLELD